MCKTKTLGVQACIHACSEEDTDILAGVFGAQAKILGVCTNSFEIDGVIMGVASLFIKIAPVQV